MGFSTAIPAKKATPLLLRYSHLMAFETCLRQRGVPVGRYLRRNALPVFCDEPDAYLPVRNIWSFFNDVARHEDPEIGWRVGLQVGDSKLNAKLLREIESAPTLFLAMNRLIQKISSEATGIDIGICSRRHDYLFYMHYPGMSGISGYTHSQAYQIGFFLGLIRHFLGRHWVPDQIGIESAIVPSMLDSYLPGCQILTTQPAGYIVVPMSCAHRPLNPWDTKSGSAENPLLTQKPVLQTHEPGYVDTLRALLKSYLADGYLTESAAAELMGTSVRTLTRKLHARYTTYGTLNDEMRFSLALEKLQNPEILIGDVAHYVGFNDQSDFTRMIRRVSGLTPSALRKALLRKAKKRIMNC